MKIYIRRKCRKCFGHGEIDCGYCGGDGYTAYGGQCPHCYGTGTEDCPDCNGSGDIEEEEEDY